MSLTGIISSENRTPSPCAQDSDIRQTNVIPAGELIHFKRNFPVFYAEFTAEEHLVSDEYLNDIESEHPSRESQARELWLQTEHLWTQFPGFIEALQSN